MNTYRVIWEIDVDADTPEDAAYQAWRMMSPIDGLVPLPPILDVIPWHDGQPPVYDSGHREHAVRVDCEKLPDPN